MPGRLEEHAAPPDDGVPVGLGSAVPARPGPVRHRLADEPEPEQEIAARMLHIPAHQPELNVQDAAERELLTAWPMRAQSPAVHASTLDENDNHF